MRKGHYSVFFFPFFLVVFILFGENVSGTENFPNYHKKVLEKGTTVVSCYLPDSPIVTVQVRVMSGLSNEGKYAGTGISHFIEHMIFRAMDDDGVTSSRKTIKAIGGIINGSTSQDSAEYHITVPKENFQRAMEIIVSMVMEPLFDEEGLEMERDVILKEMNMIDDNPGRKQLRLLCENAYSYHVYKYPIIGYRELFLDLQKEDLELYHSAVYVPDRVVLGVAGGVVSDEVFLAAEQIMKKYNRAPVWEVPVQVEPRQVAPKKAVFFSDIDIGYIAIAFHSVDIYSPDLHSLNVLASITGAGTDSLLYRRLVQEKGLLHSVNVFNLTPRFPGLFVVAGTGEPEKLNEARIEIFDVIAGIQRKSITADLLLKAINTVISSQFRAHESTNSVVSSMTAYAMFTGDPAFLKGYAREIKNVTIADVADAAKRYLTEINSTTVYTVPREFEGIFNETPGDILSKSEKTQDLKQKTLDNGLKLVAMRTGTMPLVSIRFTSRGGLMAEDTGSNGISSLMSQLMLKATKKRKEMDIVPVIERMGGSISAFSGLNSVGLSMDLMKEDLEKGLSIFSEILMAPVFPQDHLEKEKLKVIAAIREQEKDIFGVGMLGIRRMMYPGHPYSLRIDGEIDTVENLDRKEILEFYHKNVMPEGAVISVAGDIDTDEVIDLLSRTFSSWEEKNNSFKEEILLPEKDWKHQEILMKQKQSLVILGFRGVTVYDRRTYVLDVISALLSGRDGLMFDSIREDMGLAYTSGASNLSNVEDGYFILYSATTKKNLDKARDRMFDVIDMVIAGEVTDDEINASKNRLITDHASSMEGISSISSAMGFGEIYGLGPLHYQEYEVRIGEVTREDIIRVAREILDAEYAAILEIRSEL